MTGAKRDKTHDAIADDAYMSIDPRIVPALLKHVQPVGDIWEPAFGEGDLAIALSLAGHAVHGSDIVRRSALYHVELQNFFDYKRPIHPAVRTVATNPPNSINVDFTLHAIELMRQCAGVVCIYQRHEWNCSIESARVFDHPTYEGRITCRWRPKWFDPAPGQEEKSPFHKWDWFVWNWRKPEGVLPWEKFA